MFSDLFPKRRGRPSIPAPTVATVLVLQALQGFSDREAAEAVTFDLRWKAACGLPVTAPSFHPTVLTLWRRRLAASERPQRIFDAVRDVVAETGALKGKTRRALDSTVLDDAVATQDTVTQLLSAIRRVARAVPGAEDVVTETATRLAGVAGHGYERAGKPQVAWDDSSARAELVDALVRDALAVLAGLTAAGLVPTEGAGADAVGLLALIAGQDVELVDSDDPGGSLSWRIARRVAPDRVISTVDTEARHAHKTVHRRQDGFKAHVAVEPDTGIVTACALTKASGEDGADAGNGLRLLDSDTTINPQDETEVLGDSAYGTGAALAEHQDKGRKAIIKPIPVRSPVPGGLTAEDFTVDHGDRTVTCPNGLTRSFANKTRTATFGAGCRGCPFRDRCTNSRTGRTLAVGEHEALQRAHRERMNRPEVAEVYRTHRPMVERSLAWVTRGNRKLRYRGTAKNDAWLHLRVTAVNLRRLLTLGLLNHNGSWTIATA